MEQPIKNLQYFKDQVARERGYLLWKLAADRFNLLHEAAERYAAYREELAKGKAWNEACEAQKLIDAEHAETISDHRSDGVELWEVISVDKCSILSAPLATNPYKQQ